MRVETPGSNAHVPAIIAHNAPCIVSRGTPCDASARGAWSYLGVVDGPDFLVDVGDGQVEADDLVVDEQLHARVVLQQRH